jgi:hypothetical protein
MSLLRWLALLALGFWMGGLVALGAIAAPALFAVLEAHQGVAGRELAAAAFGVILDRFQYAAWIAGLALLVSIGFRAALGPRPRRFGLRMWVTAGMLAASVATVYFIAPRIRTLSASANGSVVALPADDARRVAFGRWHGASSALLIATVLAGAGLLWAEVSDE